MSVILSRRPFVRRNATPADDTRPSASLFARVIACLFAAVVAACTCADPGEGPPGIDSGPAPIADDDAYSGVYDEEELLVLPQEEGYPQLRFPRNQLVIRATEETDREQLLALLDDVDGTLIGQIPSLRIYQTKVGTTTEEELRQLLDEVSADERVDAVSYNFLLERAGPTDLDTCPVSPDNKRQFTEHTDPMDTLCELYTALEIAWGLRDAIEMRPVTIALIELGFMADGGEFDDVDISYVGPQGMVNNDVHGNAMTGLVCADNDGAGVNGVASALLGDKLHVVFSRPAGVDLHSWVLAMSRVVGSADVVVNAFYAAIDPSRVEQLDSVIADAQALSRMAMEGWPGVTFVNAAPNTGILLTQRNAFPAGARRDNMLTVGATRSYEPTRLPGTARGDLIDVSAPGEGIYVLTDDPAHIDYVDVGEASTSLAAAQVASAVALLKSVGGELSDRELRRYLLEYVGGEGLSGPIVVSGGGGVLVNYARSLLDLLFDLYGTNDWAYVMDTNEDGVADAPSSLAANLCVDFNFEVEDVGEFEFAPDADCFGQQQAISLSEDGSFLVVHVFGYDDGNSMWGTLTITPLAPEPELFQVDTLYDAGKTSEAFLLTFDAFTDRDGDCAPEFDAPGDVRVRSTALVGTFELTNCRVLERVATGEPKYLLVDLAVNAVVEALVEKPPDAHEMFTTTARGWLRSLTVRPLPPSGVFYPYIDDMCSDMDPVAD
jgi:hypothetical protein